VRCWGWQVNENMELAVADGICVVGNEGVAEM